MDRRVSAQCFRSNGVIMYKVIVLGTMHSSRLYQAEDKDIILSHPWAPSQRALTILHKETQPHHTINPQTSQRKLPSTHLHPPFHLSKTHFFNSPQQRNLSLTSLPPSSKPPPRPLPRPLSFHLRRIRRHERPVRIPDRVRSAEDAGPRPQERHAVLELARRAAARLRHPLPVHAVLRRVVPEAEGEASLDGAVALVPAEL